jgi:putative RNA 2'-phosphotransferase
MKKDLKTKSKYLSLILRHDPSVGNITLDANGWANVKDLIHNAGFTNQELETIVQNDDKQRYTFNNDRKQKIRANQGHSIADVKIDYDDVIPPQFLYHGTVQKFIDSIMKTGLKKQKRNYLHLSKDIETAISVGSRRGDVVILKISALKMYNEGYKFFISKNGVYLIEIVPSEYITILY